MSDCRFMATGKDRVTELEAAIEAIRHEVWKTGQTLPKLRHAIALILQGLKHERVRPFGGRSILHHRPISYVGVTHNEL